MVRKKAMTNEEFANWFATNLHICETGCWEWTAGKNQDGYGKIKRNGKTITAHKWSLEQSLGRSLGEGMVTRHTCHNRPCCNPAHLVEGTPIDNVRDRDAAGRTHGPRGELQGHSKLTSEQVIEIKTYTGTLTHQELGDVYGVKGNCITRIRNGTRWSHINPQ